MWSCLYEDTCGLYFLSKDGGRFVWFCVRFVVKESRVSFYGVLLLLGL